jgi:hypothetical protein
MNLIEYVMYLYAAGISGVQYPLVRDSYRGSRMHNIPAQTRRDHVSMGGELENLAA